MLELLEDPKLALLAKPALLPNGCEPERRVVLVAIGWEGHLALDEALGHDRSGPRFYYLDGDLEIVSTSKEHERIKKYLASCMDIFFEVHEVEDLPRGQATMRVLKEAGAEPDESWCFDEDKEFPDLALEIALSSGGLPKLEIYRRFAVPEVWIWRRGRLEIHCLRTDGSAYDAVRTSRVLPAVPVAALESAVAESSASLARRSFRAALERAR